MGPFERWVDAPRKSRIGIAVLVVFLLVMACTGCGGGVPEAVSPGQEATAPGQGATVPGEGEGEAGSTGPRLALWLANKDELLNHPEASFQLVMTGWFEPQEARALRTGQPGVRLLAGLTATWVSDQPEWQNFLVTVANSGDPDGPLQLTDDMYLGFDDNGDGTPDRYCSPPGWENIRAMDARQPEWQRLILAFYKNTAAQSQHDGVIVDMVDAYPFCDGAFSTGVEDPLSEEQWVAAQMELLALIREQVPKEKWVIANAGRDFPEGSPFPPYLNGYLLENFLGSWGLPDLAAGLASAQRALQTTRPPDAVIFAVDTDNTGSIDWPRFRSGLAGSLLMDNTYFAFDYGSRNHGGVADYWFAEYYGAELGEPLGPYELSQGVYRRDFENGSVIAAAGSEATVTFLTPYRDVTSGEVSTEFVVPRGDGGIFLVAQSGS